MRGPDADVEQRLWEVAQAAWEELDPRAVWNTYMVRDEMLRRCDASGGAFETREPHVGVRSRWGTAG